MAIEQLTRLDVERAPLTEGKQIRKLNDGGGLCLWIDHRSKFWRFRYRRAGKDALMSLGQFPTVPLAAARSQAQAARLMLARGQDPQDERRRERDQRWLETEKTFGIVGAEYNAKRESDAVAPKTLERCLRMYAYCKRLHGKTFAEIDRPMLLQECRALEQAGKKESAHRLGIYFAAVFRHARDEGYFKGVDPTVGGFGKSLKPVQENHQPALTDPAAVGALMRVIDGSDWLLDTGRGSTGATVSRALQLLARTVVRPGELRKAEWSEFDLTGARHDGHPTWRIPLNRMKSRGGNRTDHIVPLSKQAVAILEAQYGLTGGARYVFPNARSTARPMTDAALSVALVALGFGGQHVPHGARSTFSSLARDVLKAESELVERQLAHKVGSDVAGAYDRSQRLEARRGLMQEYSDLLDRLRDGETI